MFMLFLLTVFSTHVALSVAPPAPAAISGTAANLQQQAQTAFNNQNFPLVISILSPTLQQRDDIPMSVTFQLLELLGQSYDSLRNDASASETYERLLTLQAKSRVSPRSLLGLNGLGLLLARNGQLERAVDLMKEAVSATKETNAAVWNNYATVLHKHQRISDAVQGYQRAWSLSSKMKVYGYNLGNALMDDNRHKEAIRVLRKVIRVDKQFAEAHWKLGRCYAVVGKFKKAVSSFRAALSRIKTAVKFKEADLQFEISDAYLGCQIPKHKQAVQALERAVALEPNNPEYVFALEHLYRYTVNFFGLAKIRNSAARLLSFDLKQQNKRSFLSPMRALTFLKSSSMRVLMDGWSKSMIRITSEIASTASSASVVSTTHSLRIGFISSEWQTNSPMMHLMDRLPCLLMSSNKKSSDDITVYAYALVSTMDNAMYPESTPLLSMSSAGVVVRRLDLLSDVDAAALIYADQLDVLIDLNGFTAGSRPEIIGMLSMLKNGPFVASYLGWPATFGNTGLVQYTVVDRYAVPLETSSEHYSEKMLVLPRSFFMADHDFKMKMSVSSGSDEENVSSVAAGEQNEESSTTRRHYRQLILQEHQHQDSNEPFIFCNFNQLFKLSVDFESTLNVWSQILRRMPRSVLWLLRHPNIATPNILLQLHSSGIQRENVLLSDFAEKRTYLKRSSAADLFLDNHRYNGGGTGADAIYSGVPVLTLPTERMVGRMGNSQQHAIGAQDTITHSVKMYEDTAVRVAKSPRLARGLRRRMKTREVGGLFDVKTFCKDFVDIFKAVKNNENFHVVTRQ